MLCGSAACGLATPPFSAPAPAEFARLEDALRSDGTNTAAALSLAAGYVDAGRLADAQLVLAGAAEAVPTDPTLHLALGLVEQRLGLGAVASRRYARFLALDPTSPLANDAGSRILTLRPETLREVASTLAGADVEARRPTGQTVAVLPLSAEGSDDELSLLGVGIADLLSTDLVRAGMTVVDPALVRALVALIGVDVASRSTLSVGLDARARLGASHVVLGRVRRVADTVALSGLVLGDGPDGDVVTAVEASGTRDDLVATKSRWAALIWDALDRDPDPVGLAALAHREVVSTDALVAFSAALQLNDAVGFLGAGDAFADALVLDPGFERLHFLDELATVAAERAARPLGESYEEVVSVGERRRAVVAHLTDSGAAIRAASARTGNRDRSPVAEALGLDVLGGRVLLGLSFVLGGGP